MSLSIVARLLGERVACDTAREMEYDRVPSAAASMA
jgi:hypothetical protein